MHLNYGYAATVNLAPQVCAENIQAKVKDVTYMFI